MSEQSGGSNEPGNLRWWLRLVQLEDKLDDLLAQNVQLMHTNAALMDDNICLQRQIESLHIEREGVLRRQGQRLDALQNTAATTTHQLRGLAEQFSGHVNKQLRWIEMNR